MNNKKYKPLLSPNILFQIEQIRAISGFLNNDIDYIYRKICRWYSKNFSTSLTDTMKLPMPMLLQHYYESQIESSDYNDILDLAKTVYLPAFVNEKEEKDADFAASLIKEQEESLKKRKQKQSLKSKKANKAPKPPSHQSKSKAYKVPTDEEFDLNFPPMDEDDNGN